jgi:hypothetical protein
MKLHFRNQTLDKLTVLPVFVILQLDTELNICRLLRKKIATKTKNISISIFSSVPAV